MITKAPLMGCRCLGPLAALAAAIVQLPARADLSIVTNADDQQGRTIFKMTVTPTPAPSPLFKYRLLPSEDELRPGNAALFYARMFAEGGVSGVWKNIDKEFGAEEVHGGANQGAWYSADRPLSELPMEKVRSAASRFDTIIEQGVKRGAIRKYCDWGRHVEELSGLEIISLLLPEIQESRQLSRGLILQARVAVADRDFEKAVELLRMNYRLGQHVGSDLILVSGLVGIAQCSMGNHELVELIAAKDSPNLYWAIAAMPRPLIDISPAVRMELGWGKRIFEVIGNAESAEHAPEEWARLLASALVDARMALEGGLPSMDEPTARLAVTGLALVTYTDAKHRLISEGMEPDVVERMPVGKVIAIDASREYERLGDNFEREWYVPFPDAKKRSEADDQLEGSGLEGGIGRALARLLMPPLQAVRATQVRLDWQLNALQIVEAVRLHAAETGRLPETLNAIKLPLPLNPATGKPYEYELQGETAVLELPFSDGFSSQSWRFEIKLAKK